MHGNFENKSQAFTVSVYQCNTKQISGIPFRIEQLKHCNLATQGIPDLRFATSGMTSKEVSPPHVFPESAQHQRKLSSLHLSRICTTPKEALLPMSFRNLHDNFENKSQAFTISVYQCNTKQISGIPFKIEQLEYRNPSTQGIPDLRFATSGMTSKEVSPRPRLSGICTTSKTALPLLTSFQNLHDVEENTLQWALLLAYTCHFNLRAL